MRVEARVDFVYMEACMLDQNAVGVSHGRLQTQASSAVGLA